MTAWLSVVLLSTLSLTGNGHGPEIKRSDDVSTPSLEVLVQQQAALIQDLQARVAALESSQPKAAGTSCPNGWVHFGSSCYGVGLEPVTWEDAAGFCEKYGSNLVIIESAEENNFIKEMGHQHGFTGFWLGATDMLSEGHWFWTNGNRLISFSGLYNDRSAREPSESTDQDCLVSWKDFGYQWGDYFCHNVLPFVCEKKLQA